MSKRFTETKIPEVNENVNIYQSKKLGGWVKIHRSITEWGWYKDPNTIRLFFHLIIKANILDNVYMGETIKRGQRITSIAHLAEELKLSQKQIRVSISKLKRANVLASERANNATCLTIIKYDIYQSKIIDEGQT